MTAPQRLSRRRGRHVHHGGSHHDPLLRYLRWFAATVGVSIVVVTLSLLSSLREALALPPKTTTALEDIGSARRADETARDGRAEQAVIVSGKKDAGDHAKRVAQRRALVSSLMEPIRPLNCSQVLEEMAEREAAHTAGVASSSTAPVVITVRPSEIAEELRYFVPDFSLALHEPESDQVISRELAATGCFECPVWTALQRALQLASGEDDNERGKGKNGAVLVDIGANIGFYTMAASAAGHDVYAFEPFRANYENVCVSWRSNGNDGNGDVIGVGGEIRHQHQEHRRGRVTLFGAAATDERDTIVKFHRPCQQCKNLGGVSIRDSHIPLTRKSVRWAGEIGVKWARGVTVDQILLSTRVSKAGEGDGGGLPAVVLKVDVEGHECSALSGAKRFLHAARIRYVSMEWSRKRDCPDQSEIFSALRNKGLKPYRHVGDGQWEEIAFDGDEYQWPAVQGGRRLYDVAWSGTVPVSAVPTTRQQKQ